LRLVNSKFKTSLVVRNAFLLAVLITAASACSWDYLIWIPRNPNADALYRFLAIDGEQKKAGYIDQTGHVMIPTSLKTYGNYADEFHDGLLHLGFGGKYVDTQGKVVIDLDVENAWDFSEGLAAAMPTGSNKWGYIDTHGNFVIPPEFDSSPLGYVSPFANGLAQIRVGAKVGYVDHSGRFVIPPQFLAGESFHDDMARVVVEGPCVYVSRESACADAGTLPESVGSGKKLPTCKYTFINKDGQPLTARFDYALDFSEGLAPVAIGNLWGYIDKYGDIVIPPSFDTAQPFSEGLALVKQRGLSGYIDASGQIVITPRFKFAENFSGGLAVVGDGKSSWYIGKDGAQAIKQKFNLASPFFKGVAHVQFPADKSTKPFMAYIDPHGNVIFQY